MGAAGSENLPESFLCREAESKCPSDNIKRLEAKVHVREVNCSVCVCVCDLRRVQFLDKENKRLQESTIQLSNQVGGLERALRNIQTHGVEVRWMRRLSVPSPPCSCIRAISPISLLPIYPSFKLEGTSLES